MNKIKLGVIFGGISTEHDVSVVSGTSVLKNLNKERYEIFPIYISKQGEWFSYQKEINEIEIMEIGEKVTEIKKIENPFSYLQQLDTVFPVLHGKGGEDGTIQGMLEFLNIPCVGCPLLASSLGMDKAYTKIMFDRAGLKQANYVYLQKREEKYAWIEKNFQETIHSLSETCGKVEKKLGYPVFVKPANSGSSVGIQKAHDRQQLEEAILYASQFDTKILIEENIEGMEVECAVLGNKEAKASRVGRILPAEEFYTFDAKYKMAESKTQIPANLPEELEEEIRQSAIRAFKAIDGKGLSRVDFFVQKGTNQIMINEINTMPGFTTISMYPKLWEQMGLSYEKLLDDLIMASLEK